MTAMVKSSPKSLNNLFDEPSGSPDQSMLIAKKIYTSMIVGFAAKSFLQFTRREDAMTNDPASTEK
jgi:hypothetical protein